MIGREVIFDGQNRGHEFIGDSCHYFFGNAACRREDLPLMFPNYKFRFLHQVHGNALVQSHVEPQTADAHWSREAHLALVIQTADCLPVLYGTSDLVVAAHAGWRGLENGLLKQCALFIKEQKLTPEYIFIGPHIQAPDFEVSLDVAEKLIATYRQVLPDGPLPTLPHPDENKKKINLAQIAASQIRTALGPQIALEISRQSTFSSPFYYSYRRGKGTSDRQYSFIAKL